MRYGITLLIMGDHPFLEISKEQYDDISKAKTLLLHALHIEDKFDILLHNYAEVEVELLSRAFGEILFEASSWTESIGKLHVIGRRIINLLTTCRLYLDQIEHNFCEQFGKKSQVFVDLKAAKSKEYESYFGYRAMETIRNYVQHRGFPVHRVRLNSERIDTTGRSLIRHVAIPEVSVKTLELDGNIKPSVLAEMRTKGQYIDLRPLVREYLSSISRIHEFIRNKLKPLNSHSESVLARAQEAYKQQDGRDGLVGLAAVVEDDTGAVIDKVEIFDDFIKRRKMLMDKNRSVSYCAGHFVTNEA